MIESKYTLANKVIKAIEKCDIVTKVNLRGSIANGNVDRYSDIDLDVHILNSDVISASRQVLDSIKTEFELLIDDWALSFMPKVFVHTLYLDETELFNFVDIEYNFDNVPKYEGITNNRLSHEIKLLVLNIKRINRNDGRHITLPRMYNRLLGGSLDTDFSEQLQAIHTYLLNQNPNEKQKKLLELCSKEINMLCNML